MLRKILLVDDEEISCYLNKILLNSMGVAREVVTITDSWQALQYILIHYHQKSIPDDYGFDLIFLDLNMPGMDGFAILDDMNALGIDRTNIRVVILTSSISPEDMLKAASYGNQVQGFLTKPLRKEDVVRILASMTS